MPRSSMSARVPAGVVRVTVASALGSMAWQRVGLGCPINIATGSPRTDRLTGRPSLPITGHDGGDTVSNSVDNRPQEVSDRGSAVRTSMLLVGVLVAGVSLLHLPPSLTSQANTQVEAGPPIVKASDKWIRLGVDASSSQVPTALDQPPAMIW
jgi:hypothetical protein